MKSLVHLILFVVISLAGVCQIYAQGDRCSSIQPFCAGTTQFVFPNSNAFSGDLAVAEGGPDYRCLEFQPYPAWFFLKIKDSGDLNFRISQTVNSDGSGDALDVDFIAWGPFNEGDELCSASALSPSRIVGCSYSPSATENFLINNASTGQIYVVLITNYSEKPGFITLEQTNLNQSNSGATDCSIVNILGDDLALCDSAPVKLTARNVDATRYEFYVFDDNNNDFSLLSDQASPNFTVTSTGRYKVIAINDNTGLGFDDEILIEYFEKPTAIEPNDLLGCSNEPSAIFDLSQVYAEITQDPQNGNSLFDLNFYSSQTNFTNSIAIENPDSFEAVNQQEIIAIITNQKSGCVSDPVSFNLRIASIPVVEIEAETVFCVDAEGNLVNSQTIGKDLGPDFIYNWNINNDPDGDGVQNPTLSFEEKPSNPDISLEIINKLTGCSNNFNTKITYYSAPKNVTFTISGNDFEDGYVVSVMADAVAGTVPIYEYQLDDGAWQDQANFTNVKPGLHKVSARDIYGCGMATSAAFRLIGYARFFTPNGDGFNDTWNVINDPQISISKVLIYDRYGKLIKQLDPRGRGWDGTYNGEVMPADDYWFVVDLKDQNTGTVSEFTGHFTLKL
ncbi:T9SS type B sorting domain-containing protein [Gillisia hiemivivida]|uniref:T9SS type B sorting domain-containing protein n=1 Tax=Gillisia hiemivivida TaxID=291190 RepID=A0A5C6ZRM1_9FLAO|nr:T9SS type B sorting domain-containing protein [Gillisia hiemivivida]TXD91709.1 T9SS type B sorting domain-containing protein [Gillisia hiemivivida]